ncbi:hypothetical protein NBE98_06365 [Clostridium swellfunianum]|uniref:hypothetical protein n=1 Tax=Clostridium swellfunianum TaxID=1367462 RepID=UPI00202EF1A0|nr:hypothetical protein [Clostridium swellfunianum]MCM0647995.1 hypothetical protein [Clostridium swellfunianum]
MPVGREIASPDPPKTQPPNFIPDKDKAHALGFTKTPGTNLVFQTTILPCQYEITYVWLKNNNKFWCKPVNINQNSMTCWIWNGSRWASQMIQLRDIDTFICKYF